MPANVEELIAVFTEVRALLAHPDNNFDWSSWNDAEDALAEIDDILERLRSANPLPINADILFAPTGPLQEVSLSSGWGDAFIAIANRYDAASG